MDSKCEGKNCMLCMYNFGAVKHFCNKRGGDGTFETSGSPDRAPKVDVFEPYILRDGPIQEQLGELKGKNPHYIEGESKSGFDDAWMVETRQEEKWLLESLGIHKGEKGEKIFGGTKIGMRERPRKRIYSFIKG